MLSPRQTLLFYFDLGAVLNSAFSFTQNDFNLRLQNPVCHLTCSWGRLVEEIDSSFFFFKWTPPLFVGIWTRHPDSIFRAVNLLASSLDCLIGKLLFSCNGDRKTKVFLASSGVKLAIVEFSLAERRVTLS